MKGEKRLGMMNPNAISKDRPNEIFQNWRERESFILPSGYTVGQSFAALRKLWDKFRAYRHDFNIEGQRLAAAQIQDIQREMGIAVAQFPELGLYITDEELPANVAHEWQEVMSLHEEIEERKAAEENENEDSGYTDVMLEDAYSKRKSCEHYRY